MSEPYAVEFTPTAAAQLQRPFPDAAFKALYDVLVAISRDPWGQTSRNRLEESEAFRWATFGEDGGVYLYVDDDARAVRVYHVTWLG